MGINLEIEESGQVKRRRILEEHTTDKRRKNTKKERKQRTSYVEVLQRKKMKRSGNDSSSIAGDSSVKNEGFVRKKRLKSTKRFLKEKSTNTTGDPENPIKRDTFQMTSLLCNCVLNYNVKEDQSYVKWLSDSIKEEGITPLLQFTSGVIDFDINTIINDVVTSLASSEVPNDFVAPVENSIVSIENVKKGVEVEIL